MFHMELYSIPRCSFLLIVVGHASSTLVIGRSDAMSQSGAYTSMRIVVDYADDQRAQLQSHDMYSLKWVRLTRVSYNLKNFSD